MSLPRDLPDPECAKCDKPISVLWALDNEGREEIWFMSQCHGRSELMKLSYAKAEAAERWGLLKIVFKGDPGVIEGSAHPRGFVALAGDIAVEVTKAASSE